MAYSLPVTTRSGRSVRPTEKMASFMRKQELERQILQTELDITRIEKDIANRSGRTLHLTSTPTARLVSSEQNVSRESAYTPGLRSTPHTTTPRVREETHEPTYAPGLRSTPHTTTPRVREETHEPTYAPGLRVSHQAEVSGVHDISNEPAYTAWPTFHASYDDSTCA